MATNTAGSSRTWEQEEGDRIRELIKHECELLNHRITWLVNLNGLAFTALAFAWSNNDAKVLVPVLAGIGIVASIVLVFPIAFADVAIKGLFNLWERKRLATYEVPVIGLRRKGASFWWIAIPVLFIVAWIVVYLTWQCGNA